MPPFENLSGYVAAVRSLVPDNKGGYVDRDFVSRAIEGYSEDNPAYVVVDVGDGSAKAWAVGTSPLSGWVPGFSESHGFTVETLSGGSSQTPRHFLDDGRDFWTEYRDVSGTATLHLVTQFAPSSADQYRVRFRKRWLVDDEASPSNEIPLHHQMAVVYAAAAEKSQALASWYRRTADPDSGSDLFSASEVADGYMQNARNWREKYVTTLGLRSGPAFRSTTVRPDRQRVFPRGAGL